MSDCWCGCLFVWVCRLDICLGGVVYLFGCVCRLCVWKCVCLGGWVSVCLFR